MSEKPKIRTIIDEDPDISADSLSTLVTRRENAVDDALIIANDEKGKTYLANVHIGSTVTVEYKWVDGDNIWIESFAGTVVELNPSLNMSGEVCAVRAYGKANATKNMRVAQEYGVYSKNHNDILNFDLDLAVDGWTFIHNDWSHANTNPYLHDDEDTNKITMNVLTANLGKYDEYYTFADQTALGYANELFITVKLRIKGKLNGRTDGADITPYIWNGTAWVNCGSTQNFTSTDYEILEWDISSILDTHAKVNSARLKIVFDGYSTAEGGYIDITYAHLKIDGYGIIYQFEKLRDIVAKDDLKSMIYGFVNRILGTSATSGYALNTDYVWDCETLLPYIQFLYESAFDSLTDLIKYVGAKRYPLSGIHWIVLPDGKLCIAPVGAHSVEGKAGFNIESVWKTYARITPIEVTKQMILQDFTSHEPEANYILMTGVVEIPNSEAWTEGKASEWITQTNGDSAICSNDNTVKVPVEGNNYSLKCYTLGIEGVNSNSDFKYTNFEPMNIEKIGSGKNIPSINFSIRRDSGIMNAYIVLWSGSDYFIQEIVDIPTDSFLNISLDIGPSSQNWDKNDGGNPLWSNITAIGFHTIKTGGIDCTLWADRLKINGWVMRAAYNSNSWKSVEEGGQGFPCKMKFIKDNITKTDNLNINEDTIGLALSAKAELIRSMVAITTGKIIIPLDPTILAGQLIHIHTSRTTDLMNYPSGFMIDRDFRIIELQHSFMIVGATTTLTLVDDVTNSLSLGPADAYGMIMKSLPDYQTKDMASLKAADVDLGLIILSIDYAT